MLCDEGGGLVGAALRFVECANNTEVNRSKNHKLI